MPLKPETNTTTKIQTHRRPYLRPNGHVGVEVALLRELDVGGGLDIVLPGQRRRLRDHVEPDRG